MTVIWERIVALGRLGGKKGGRDYGLASGAFLVSDLNTMQTCK